MFLAYVFASGDFVLVGEHVNLRFLVAYGVVQTVVITS
jgi:hypothetical protein